MYQNQIFHYTRCTLPKRVTSWRGPSQRHCTLVTPFLLRKCLGGGEPLARFEPKTSCSKNERVTARPTGYARNFAYILQLKLIVVERSRKTMRLHRFYLANSYRFDWSVGFALRRLSLERNV